MGTVLPPVLLCRREALQREGHVRQQPKQPPPGQLLQPGDSGQGVAPRRPPPHRPGLPSPRRCCPSVTSASSPPRPWSRRPALSVCPQLLQRLDILRRIHLGQDCNELNSMTVTFTTRVRVAKQC